MTLVPLPAFADNYIWMLHDGRHALVVDPGEAGPVFDALAHRQLQLAAILVTHHHADHTGGVAALREATGAVVFGPARERIPEPFTPLAQGDQAEALGLRFEVIDIPGHTAGHIAFYLPSGERNAETPDGQPTVQPPPQMKFSGSSGPLRNGANSANGSPRNSLIRRPTQIFVDADSE